MTEEKLKQFKAYKRRLEQLCEEIAELQARQSVACDSVKASGNAYPYTAYTSVVLAPALPPHIEKRLQQAKAEHAQLCKEYTQLFAEITDFICTVDDCIVRRALDYRYIQGYSWTATAFALGGTVTPDSVRVSCRRYLQSQSGK